MKFGVRLAVQGEMGAQGQGWDYVRKMAIEAEELGFDSLWLPDHVMNAHMNTQVPMLECWTVLSALAAVTKKIVFAGHTFNNSLRHPAVMAKMAATFDVISGGRLIYSLGSAWFERESRGYGLPWDNHDDRVARLREAFLIAKAMWTKPEVTFKGRFYELEAAQLAPKPSHIPLWVPGDSHATRDLVAELADCWLFYSKSPDIVSGFREDMLKRTGGRSIPMSTSTVSLAGLSNSETEKWSVLYAEERKHRFPIPPTPADVINDNLAGPDDQCIERITDWRQVGISHLVIQPIPPLEGMRYFAKKIMPAIKR